MLLLLALAWASDAAPFQDLDFESPELPLIEDGLGRVPIASSLPGWTGYFGGTEVPWTFYNNISLGSAAISLHGLDSIWRPLDGSYSVLLQPSGGPVQIVPALAQVGTIPLGSQSMRFYGAMGIISLSFSGQQIPISILGDTSSYSVYGADVSMLAGQTGELRFQGSGFLDNIQFSAQPVPEPSTWALLGLSMLALSYRLKRRVR